MIDWLWVHSFVLYNYDGVPSISYYKREACTLFNRFYKVSKANEDTCEECKFTRMHFNYLVINLKKNSNPLHGNMDFLIA